MNQVNKSNEINLLSKKLLVLLDGVLQHDGFGDIHISVKILKRQQKEVIIHYGKQYRFVINWPQSAINGGV